jgi:hypothetical protein
MMTSEERELDATEVRRKATIRTTSLYALNAYGYLARIQQWATAGQQHASFEVFVAV